MITDHRPKVALDKPSSVHLSATPKALAGAFGMLVTGPGITREVTFHHPVGATPLDDDEWVMSERSDIPLLLARVGPEPQVLAAYRAATEVYRLTAAVDAGLLVVVDNEYFYPGVPRVDRTATLRAARAALKLYQRGKGQDDPDRTLPDYLPERERPLEEALTTFWGSEQFREDLNSDVPEPAHETMGGTFADQSQTPVPFLKGKTTAGAVDALFAAIKQARPEPRTFAGGRGRGRVLTAPLFGGAAAAVATQLPLEFSSLMSLDVSEDKPDAKE